MKSREQLLEVISHSEPQRYSYLSNLFKSIPDEIIRELSYKKINKNDYLIHAKMPCDRIYIILSGSIGSLDFQKQGRAYYLDFDYMDVVGDCEVFGDISEYTVSICAMKDTEVLILPSKYYLQWMHNDENALFMRLKSIVSKLIVEKKNEREYLFMTCKERLINFIVDAYENKKQNHSEKYRLNKTQVELADRLGFNIRSIQRSIAALEKEKLISIEHKKIMISYEQYLDLKHYTLE